MATFRWTSVLDVPFERVWDFHSRIDGLDALTPAWVGLSVDSIHIPPGGPEDVLVPGSEITLSARPLGVIPGGTWRSRITDRRESADSAMFQDIIVDGPLEEWTHTHRFDALPYGTLIHDTVEYALPVPGTDQLMKPPLAAYFAYRHHRTARVLG